MGNFLKELKSTIRGGLLYIFSGNILVKAIAMISSFVIARIVDKTAYAHYSYATNLYQYVEVFAGLGLSTAILKFCSTSSTQEKNKAYLQYAGTIGCIVQFLLSLLLCLIVFCVDIPFLPAKKYVYMLVLMPTISYLLSLVQSYCRTLLRNRLYSALGVLNALAVCVLGICLTYFFSISGMILARYISIFITILVGLFYVGRPLSHIESAHLCKEDKRKLLNMGISLMISSIFSTLMPVNETFLVNNIIQDEVIIANFKVAGLFPEQLLLITSSIVIYYFPIFSKITDPSELWSKAKRIGIINFCFVLLCAVLGMLLNPLAIRILYGSKYIDAIPLTYMLWIMRLTNAGIRMIPMNILPAVGHSKFNAVTAVVSCILQTSLDYLMITHFGIYGVAYSTIFVYLVFGVITWGYLFYICKTRKIY